MVEGGSEGEGRAADMREGETASGDRVDEGRLIVSDAGRGEEGEDEGGGIEGKVSGDPVAGAESVEGAVDAGAAAEAAPGVVVGVVDRIGFFFEGFDGSHCLREGQEMRRGF